MPDAVIKKDPQSAHRLKANGYATLKELNYYQGMEMRDGYEEIWTYGNQAEPELRETKFYDIPYLVGCPSNESSRALESATETISEFLISMIVKAEKIEDSEAQFLTSAFYSNATSIVEKNDRDPGKCIIDKKEVSVERPGSSHEFPRCFAAIGFASASIPKKLVRAYVVKEICEQAGIKPVSPADYAAMAAKADGTMLLPFRDMDDMPNGETGSAEAKAIIKPIANIHKIVHASLFDYVRDLKLDIEPGSGMGADENENGSVAFQGAALVLDNGDYCAAVYGGENFQETVIALFNSVVEDGKFPQVGTYVNDGRFLNLTGLLAQLYELVDGANQAEPVEGAVSWYDKLRYIASAQDDISRIVGQEYAAGTPLAAIVLEDNTVLVFSDADEAARSYYQSNASKVMASSAADQIVAYMDASPAADGQQAQAVNID